MRSDNPFFLPDAFLPVWLLSARPALAEELLEHLVLPAPYGLRWVREAAQVGTGPLLLLDAGIVKPAQWQTACLRLGTNTAAPGETGITFPLRISALAERAAAFLPHVNLERSPSPIGAHTAYLPNERALTARGGGRVALTQKESELLLFLFAARGTEVSRERLLTEIWGYDALAASHTVETHLYRLRQKLKEAGADDLAIQMQQGALRLEISAS